MVIYPGSGGQQCNAIQLHALRVLAGKHKNDGSAVAPVDRTGILKANLAFADEQFLRGVETEEKIQHGD